MDGCKFHEEQEVDLGRGHDRREQDARNGVDVDRNQASQKQYSDEIGKEDCFGCDRQRNQIDVVAAVGEDGVPAPNGHSAGHRHGKHNKEVLVGKSGLQHIDVGDSSQPLRESSVLVQQQERYEAAGHGQKSEHETDPEVESFGVGITATAENASNEKLDHSAERSLAVVLPPMPEDVEG